MANGWSPRLTRGLFPSIQRAVREGISFRDTLGAVHRAGERPDAATFSRLYSRAVWGSAVQAAEADYRSRVDRGTYLARRPSGQMAADLPFNLSTNWRQVVRMIGTEVATGRPKELYVNVDTNVLLSRGRAIEQAVMLLSESPLIQTFDVEEVEYATTWHAGP